VTYDAVENELLSDQEGHSIEIDIDQASEEDRVDAGSSRDDKNESDSGFLSDSSFEQEFFGGK